MKDYLIYTLFLCLFFLACKKDSGNNEGAASQLPEITTEGKNTFGCLIDGRPYVVTGSSGNFFLEATVVWDSVSPFYGSRIVANIHRDSGPSDSAMIINTQKRTIITKNDVIRMGGGFVSGYDYFGEANYVIDTGASFTDNYYSGYAPAPSGEVQYLRLDIDNRILSGTFWFDAYNLQNGLPNKKVEIREGRFDIKF